MDSICNVYRHKKIAFIIIITLKVYCTPGSDVLAEETQKEKNNFEHNIYMNVLFDSKVV